jgi:hypothetical protein
MASEWNVKTAKKSLVAEHIDRCIENYGMPLDEGLARKVDRSVHEQMRADLMLAVGMLAALLPTPNTTETE